MQTLPSPLIGITPGRIAYEADHGSFRRYALTTDYADAVLAAGGIPVILPFQMGSHESLLNRLDGLLFTGGADVAPAHYGDASIHPDTYGVDADRDAFELSLVGTAIGRGMPMLAICRGIQVLNVALGGTLHQHVPDRFQGVGHRQHERHIPANEPGHTVTVVLGSALGEAVGVESLPVNSFHHQAIDRVATDLVVTATSDDGVIEAVEHRTHPQVMGVQWHPELMAASSATQASIFTSLIVRAAEHSLSPTR